MTGAGREREGEAGVDLGVEPEPAARPAPRVPAGPRAGGRELRDDGQGRGEAEPTTENLPSPPGSRVVTSVDSLLSTDVLDAPRARAGDQKVYVDFNPRVDRVELAMRTQRRPP